MNHPLTSHLRRASVAALLGALAVGRVLAAPGAHGPNGEHLDEKSTATHGTGLPRVEAKSELFELVANIKGGELTILIDRFETNEPVLGAKLEVESGALKAAAAFRADTGDYVVTDSALLKALSAPGEHALVFTLKAAADADLLDGTLVTRASNVTVGDHGHSHGGGSSAHDLERAGWIGAGALSLGLLASAAWWRQRRRGIAAASRTAEAQS